MHKITLLVRTYLIYAMISIFIIVGFLMLERCIEDSLSDTKKVEVGDNYIVTLTT